jgi:hypothetical protein
MHIANPIYNVVFKFMLEDEKAVKSFISAIIEEEVLDIDFAAQEHTFHRSLNHQNPKTAEEIESFLPTYRS